MEAEGLTRELGVAVEERSDVLRCTPKGQRKINDPDYEMDKTKQP